MDEQSGLFDVQVDLLASDFQESDEPGATDPVIAPQRGPANRMNDLVYRDWMKFQKSFFRHISWERLVEEQVRFFTKATWPDGRPSATLLIGFPELLAHVSSADNVDGVSRLPTFPDRDVALCSATTIGDMTAALARYTKANKKFDFILLDLRERLAHDQPTRSVDAFIASEAPGLFATIRGLLFDERYCGAIVPHKGPGGKGFPVPWAVAKASRDSLRLRDERIGLNEQDDTIYYNLFFQAAPDAFRGETVTSAKVRTCDDMHDIPGWIIPKPPPRKKGELLHPAKFPETLIVDFIKLFTKEGDGVLDPMMGTASTLIAAIRTNRVGYGVELTPHFYELAAARLEDELKSLFSDGIPGQGNAFAYLGDATELAKSLPSPKGSIRYCVTSPPYWSMLANKGSENQRARRTKGLRTVYSDSGHDLGNVPDYSEFVGLLVSVYRQVADVLDHNGYLTVIVKNIKRNHTVFPLGWDLTTELCGPTGPYEYIGNTLWCQNDVSMKPFAVGTHWVSNTVHQYCLHYRKKD
jgi:DNA modification methylase